MWLGNIVHFCIMNAYFLFLLVCNLAWERRGVHNPLTQRDILAVRPQSFSNVLLCSLGCASVKHIIETSDVSKCPNTRKKFPVGSYECTWGWEINRIFTNRKPGFVSRKVLGLSSSICLKVAESFLTFGDYVELLISRSHQTFPFGCGREIAGDYVKN